MGVFGRGRPGWGVIGHGVGCIGVGGRRGGGICIRGFWIGGRGGGGGGAIGAWWIHCSIHLQMCSSKTGSVPRTLSLL